MKGISKRVPYLLFTRLQIDEAESDALSPLDFQSKIPSFFFPSAAPGPAQSSILAVDSKHFEQILFGSCWKTSGKKLRAGKFRTPTANFAPLTRDYLFLSSLGPSVFLLSDTTTNIYISVNLDSLIAASATIFLYRQRQSGDEKALLRK